MKIFINVSNDSKNKNERGKSWVGLSQVKRHRKLLMMS